MRVAGWTVVVVKGLAVGGGGGEGRCTLSTPDLNQSSYRQDSPQPPAILAGTPIWLKPSVGGPVWHQSGVCLPKYVIISSDVCSPLGPPGTPSSIHNTKVGWIWRLSGYAQIRGHQFRRLFTCWAHKALPHPYTTPRLLDFGFLLHERSFFSFEKKIYLLVIIFHTTSLIGWLLMSWYFALFISSNSLWNLSSIFPCQNLANRRWIPPVFTDPNLLCQLLYLP